MFPVKLKYCDDSWSLKSRACSPYDSRVSNYTMTPINSSPERNPAYQSKRVKCLALFSTIVPGMESLKSPVDGSYILRAVLDRLRQVGTHAVVDFQSSRGSSELNSSN
jgi:hypothetical protein